MRGLMSDQAVRLWNYRLRKTSERA
jgi:hypothetical protein